jgi:hypothetical protein
MVDDETLRNQARQAMQAGDLPSRLADKVWAGAGTTGRCAICGESLASDVEFELVFTDDWHAVNKTCSVHNRCLKAFESAVGGLPHANSHNGQRNGLFPPVMDAVEPPDEA